MMIRVFFQAGGTRSQRTSRVAGKRFPPIVRENIWHLLKKAVENRDQVRFFLPRLSKMK